MRKIILAGHWLDEKGLQIAEHTETNDFNVNEMYKNLRGENNKVTWRRMIYNNQGSL